MTLAKHDTSGPTLLFEPICRGGEHAPVNAAMLRMARLAFPGSPIVFAGDATHIDRIQELSPGIRTCVDWRAVDVPPRHTPRGWAKRRREWQVWNELVRLIDRHGADRVILLSITPFGLWDIKAWLWRRPRIPVLVVLHSLLNSVMASRRSKLEWWFAPAPKLRWLVLGRHIVDALKVEFGAIVPNVSWMPHPVLGLESEPEPALGRYLTPEGQTVFSFPGLATTGKGFLEFCQVAEAMASDPRARFELVGRLTPESQTERPLNVTLPDNGDRQLGRPEYERRIRRADYLLLPLRPNAYQYVASGSLMDALALGRPLIGLAASPPTRDLFAEFGDVGYLCEDLEAIVELVRTLAERPDPARYRHQLDNLENARAALAPEALAGRLRGSFG
jgi:hypothetical protein